MDHHPIHLHGHMFYVTGSETGRQPKGHLGKRRPQPLLWPRSSRWHNANLTLGQAAAEIRAATGSRRHESLSELGGWVFGGGRGGTSRVVKKVFSYDIILGGKLRLNRQVFD